MKKRLDYPDEPGRRSALLGAMIGDIAGSRFEICNYKKKFDYHLFSPRCQVTDDSIMSLAVAGALTESEEDLTDRTDPGGEKAEEICRNLAQRAAAKMQFLGRRYPDVGYGGRFLGWIYEENPKPYGSYGNGAAMRIGPVGQIARSLEEARDLAKAVTMISHDHPQAVKGAQAAASAVFLAGNGQSKEEIRDYIGRHDYEINFTLDEIRKNYSFDVSCQGSVPQALEAFFESSGFEDAIRCAISIGGDSDTIAAICGSIAGRFYGVPQAMEKDALTFLDACQLEIYREFESFSDRLQKRR